ncbi:MAG: hypothetical protein ACLUD2_04865 [Clostridium sp.]
MESLLRTRVDCFVLEDSLTLSQIEKLRDAGRVEEHVVPVEGVFWDFRPLPQNRETGTNWYITEIRSRRSLQSRKRTAKGADSSAKPEGRSETECNLAASLADRFDGVRVYDSEHQFIGIYRYNEEKRRYQPQKIFLGETSYEGDYRDQESFA